MSKDALSEILTPAGIEAFREISGAHQPPLQPADVRVQHLLNRCKTDQLQDVLTKIGHESYKRFVGSKSLVPADVTVQHLLNHRRDAILSRQLIPAVAL